MRQQYHFRDSPQGLQAWDVTRLIRRTQGLQAEEVPLHQLRELDEPYWYRDEGAEPTGRSIAEHMRLVLAADLAYPIILCPEGRLMDGMHRAVKALVQGQSTLRAYRLPQLPPPDHVGVHPDALPYDDA
jgi:hypothetical protein